VVTPSVYPAGDLDLLSNKGFVDLSAIVATHGISAGRA
jgi:hypothetical protein